jgi:hypothetical protein
MPKCKNIKTKSYTGTEPSPKGLGYCASGENVGVKKKGRDKCMWIVKKISNGTKRWFKYKKEIKIKYKIGEDNFLDISDVNKNKKRIVHYRTVKYHSYINDDSIIGIKGNKGFIHKLVDYNKFESKETKINKKWREIKGFHKYSEEVFDISKKGVLNKNNKAYEKIKKENKNAVKYMIETNMSIPYVVYINKNCVSVYKRKNDYFYGDVYGSRQPEYWMYVEKILSIKPKKVFTGKVIDPDNMLYGFEKLEGNSILISTHKKNEYILIDEEIYKFKTSEPIKNFYSYQTSNGIPFPSAMSENYIYILSYCKKIYYPIKLFTGNKNYDELDYESKQNPDWTIFHNKKKFEGKSKEFDVIEYYSHSLRFQ